MTSRSTTGRFLGATLAAALLASGCGGQKVAKIANEMRDKVPDETAYFHEGPDPASAAHERVSGSLWQDAYASNLYTNMYRASRIGDTVTIVVSEQTTGLTDVKTNTKKKSENNAGIDALGTVMSTLSRIFTNLNPAKLISATTDNKYDGQGKIDGKGSLFTTITCRVVDKLPNGNMVIQGEKRLKIARDEQILKLEGIIRPYDVMPDNTVSSVSVADARISFTGLGVVAERQSPGWLARILDYVWPF